MWSEMDTPKSEESKVGFSFMAMLWQLVGFGQRFLREEQCGNTGASHILC